MSIIEKIDSLCRQVILHSIIYYDYDSNVISDKRYDKIAIELESLVNKNKDLIKECFYYECLKDYTSATGFDLKYKLTEEHKAYLEKVASWVLFLYNAENSKKGKR